MGMQKKLQTLSIQVDMPVPRDGPNKGIYQNTAGWWAIFLLELGEKAQYGLLLHYLDLAHKQGCLRVIRQAAEEVVRDRTASKPGLRKVKRPSGSFKAVA